MDEEDWAFHRESLGPWGRASDGWVDLDQVLSFLEAEHGEDQDAAARRLKPAIVRGEVPHRVPVLAGRWDYVQDPAPAVHGDELPSPSIRRVWVTEVTDLVRDRRRTETVQRLGGWFFVDWQRGEAKGHTIQVEWRAVLRVLGLDKPGDPEPMVPEVEPTSRGGRLRTPFWQAFHDEVLRQIYEGDSKHRDQLRENMDAWATTHTETFSRKSVPSKEHQNKEMKGLIPRSFPERGSR